MNALGNSRKSNPHKIEKYTSALTATLSSISDSTVTFDVTGVFSGKPDIITTRLVFTGDEDGYVAGEVIYESTFHLYRESSSILNRGIATSISPDNNTISVTFGENASFISKSTFNMATAETNIKVEVFAIRFVIGDQPDITRVGLVPLEKKVVNSGVADLQFDLQQYSNEYESFHIDFVGAVGATAAQSILYRLSQDGGSTFISTTNYDYNYHGEYNSAENGATSVNQTFGPISIGGTSTTSTSYRAHGSIDIINPFTDDVTITFGQCQGRDHTNAPYIFHTGCVFTTAGAITDIQIFAATGNLHAGEFVLYGKRKVQ